MPVYLCNRRNQNNNNSKQTFKNRLGTEKFVMLLSTNRLSIIVAKDELSPPSTSEAQRGGITVSHGIPLHR